MLIITKKKICRGPQGKELPWRDLQPHPALDFAAGGTAVQPGEAPAPVMADLVSGLYLRGSLP